MRHSRPGRKVLYLTNDLSHVVVLDTQTGTRLNTSVLHWDQVRSLRPWST